MTVCNMSIEAGARAGMIAPDQTTFDYLPGPPARPDGRRLGRRGRRVADPAQRRRRGVRRRGRPRREPSSRPSSRGAPTPGRGCRSRSRCRTRSRSPTRATGSRPPTRSRTWDSRRARRCATSGSTRSSSVRAPTAGSRTCGPPPTSSRATRSPTACGCSSCPARPRSGCRPRPRGSTRVFTEAGAEWRLAGCSMCLGMNPDQLAPGERSASTSNRNFEGRQGKGGRTHLVSPLVAAATAVRGTLSSPSDLDAPRHSELAPPRPERPEPWKPSRPTPASACRCGAATSTPTRSSRPSTSSGSPAPGFEDGLFAAWRKDESFVLNNPTYAAGSVLVAGPDFGTGSSREHAVWALMNYGFRVVISLPVRRHLPRQQRQAGAAHRDRRAGRRRADLEVPGERAGSGGHGRPRHPDRPRRRDRGVVRDRRLHALAAARGSRRHRTDAATRGRGDEVRGISTDAQAGDHARLRAARRPGSSLDDYRRIPLRRSGIRRSWPRLATRVTHLWRAVDRPSWSVKVLATQRKRHRGVMDATPDSA